VKKGLSTVWGIILTLVMLNLPFAAVVEAAPAAKVAQSRFPVPTSFVLNMGDPGTGTEYFWWSIEYDTNPIKVTFEIYGPRVSSSNVGPLVHSEEWAFPADGLPDFNPESLLSTTVQASPAPTNTSFSGNDVSGFPAAGSKLILSGNDVGAYTLSGTVFTLLTPLSSPPDTGDTISVGLNYGNHNYPENAHKWLLPAGTKPGTYTSYVRYYSQELGSITPESGAEQTFWVRQPLQILKYNDLEGNGIYEYGKVADFPVPTTATFSSTDLTPNFPDSGESLFISGVDVGAYNLEDNTFTLESPLSLPPTSGEIISLNPGLSGWEFEVTGPGGYSDQGFTGSLGYLVLDNASITGEYTFTEILQPHWVNTDPGGNPPYQKVITIPDDLDPTNPVIRFGNYELPRGTQVTIEADQSTILTNTGTYLTVTETNSGEVSLSDPYVVVLKNGDSFQILEDSPTSGDDGNGILDIGETWIWDNIETGNLTANTTFQATGHGTDQLGNDITYPPYLDEQDEVTVYVINPGTGVTITSDASTVLVNTGTILTVTETNQGDVSLTNPYVILLKNEDNFRTLSAPPTSGDDGNGILDAGETWTWDNIPTGALSVNTVFQATGHGTDQLGNDITYPAYPHERDEVTVYVISPGTRVTIDAENTTLLINTGTKLTVTETNTGDVPLENPYVVVLKDGDNFETFYAPPSSGDNGNNILDLDETWTWDNIETGNLTANTTFQATGHGTDPLGNDITYPPYLDEQDDVTIRVINPNTEVNIEVNDPVILIDTATFLSVTEANTGDAALSNPSVVITKNGNEFVTLTAPADSGDTDNPGVLDPGEIWNWTSVSTGSLAADTEFIATGHGFDEIGNDITVPVYPDELDFVYVRIINPNTALTLTVQEPTILIDSSTTLTVTEANTGDVPLIYPHVVITKNGQDFTELIAPPDEGDMENPGVLDAGEIWTWNLSTGNLMEDALFVAIGHGTDELANDITFPKYPSERAEVSIDVINPNTAITISAFNRIIYVHTSTTLTVAEANRGDVPLTNPHVVLLKNGSNFDELVGPPTRGDGETPGVLDPGETWIWDGIPTGVLLEDTEFEAIGHGTDPLGNDITLPGYPDEWDKIIIDVINPDTYASVQAHSSKVLINTSTMLTITESNVGDVPLEKPHVVVQKNLAHFADLEAPPTSGDDGNRILDVGETWTWNLSTGNLSSTVIFSVTGHGKDALSNDISYPCFPGERAYIPVIVFSPITYVEIDACQKNLASDGTVTLLVTEHNAGDVPLTDPWVEVTPGIGRLEAPPSGGDLNQNNILDIGESWWWSVENVSVDFTTTFVAIGHGYDPLFNDVTYPAYPTERATCIIEVYSSIRGDVNGDGKVNVGDIAKLELILMERALATPAADCNQDGIVTIGDIVALKRIIMGLD